LERRLEIKVLEVIQSTCNDTTNSIQFENFREIKRERERERERVVELTIEELV
jgi:hypothetical protein